MTPLGYHLTEKLKEELLKSNRGNKDQIYVEDSYIIVKIPEVDDFLSIKKDLTSLIDTFMVNADAKRVAVKITNGNDVDILSWGF